MSYTLKYADLPRYVWHAGKCWHNPRLPLDHRGHVSLYSLKEDGAGIGAPPDRVYPCDEKTIQAIWQAQAAGQLIKF